MATKNGAVRKAANNPIFLCGMGVRIYGCRTHAARVAVGGGGGEIDVRTQQGMHNNKWQQGLLRYSTCVNGEDG